jgi:hypothetical protein
MNRTFRVRFFPVLVLLAVAVEISAIADSSHLDSAIVLSFQNEAIAVGSPVQLQIVFQNTSSAEIADFREKSGGEREYRIQVWNQVGDLVPETRYYHSFKCATNEGPCDNPDPTFGLISDSFPLRLALGQSVKTTVDLRTLFVLDRPGDYTVQVQRDTEWMGGAHLSAFPRSNKEKFTIVK